MRATPWSRFTTSRACFLELVDFVAWDTAGLGHAALEQELETLLQRPVDVLTERGLAPALRERITADARAL